MDRTTAGDRESVLGDVTPGSCEGAFVGYALRRVVGLSATFAAMLLATSACTSVAADDQPAAASASTEPATVGEMAAPRNATNPDYRLSSGDIVVIEMFEQKDIQTSQRLTATGEIRLPMIGRVKLDGMTVRDAEVQIERLYKDGGFFVNPQIVVFVQTYAEKFVSILGQVGRPSQIQLPEESNSIGILQAITLAGGFTRIANTESVQVTRKDTDGNQRQFTVDVRELFNSKDSSNKREFQLLAGDVVLVRERTF